ncbi:Sulfur carrier protein ThiS adenylyltransferase [Piscirickettsia salmonis]|nr:Sulfur carrier protein ThiS adenylyltransferase [Piscirickettsia salmonis]
MFFVLLSMPRLSGQRAELLLRFSSVENLLHPILKFDKQWQIQPFHIERFNKQYLLERGGADSLLNSKKVTIVGCGSVGSEIAVMLAKAGVGTLVLVDDDTLHGDNIHRHRLGGISLSFMPKSDYFYKVDLLSSMLHKDLPYVKVCSKKSKFEQVTVDKDVQNSDVIVVATGSPISSLSINRKLIKLKVNSVIICWNEASGYGGHSVSLNLTESCLECIFTSESGFSMSNPLALLQVNQDTSNNLTGCGGVFTPFSYLDSSRTACLAVKQSIDFLQGNCSSKALSWKGENKNSLRVTDRFSRMPLQEEIMLKKHKNCRVCND